MNKEKLIYIMAKLMKEEMPLMTPVKCKNVARKLVGILKEYEALKPLEDSDVSAKDTQLSQKS